jgi:hypothetical protein|nr:MAG TPA: hypothetical protein [Caudoviricetes sp.]
MITTLVCAALFLFVLGAFVDSLDIDGAEGICVLILLALAVSITLACVFRLIEVVF